MSNFNHLFEQFKEVKEYQDMDATNDMIEEFISWIDIHKKMGTSYRSLLNDMELFFDKEECAEIGKGKYDSIVSNYDTTVITPDEDIKPHGIYINSGFKVYNGSPVLIKQTTEKKISFFELNTNLLDTFMTQNPYNINLIENWDELHNNAKAAIIIGIYGDVKDKNIKQKKKQLQEFKDKLHDNYMYESAIYGNTYCEVVATKRKVKTYELIKN